MDERVSRVGVFGPGIATRARMNRNDVRITSPCTLDWKKMTPAEGGRFCGDCKKVVKDLSRMTEREARALLKNAGGGELCVRFVYDERGRVFFGGDAATRDPLVPASLLHRARRVAAAAAVAALPFANQACDVVAEPLGITSDEQRSLPPDHGESMGGISSDPRDTVAAEDDAGASDGSIDATGDAIPGDVDASDVDASADADAGDPFPPPN